MDFSVLKKLFLKPTILIFLLALALRLYGLSDTPPGFHVDEAKAAWNALSILETGKDDWGNSFPLYYNSFGDFRPTGYFYLIIPSLLAFGQNVFAVRFPGVLFGSLTIVILYFFTLQILGKEHKKAAVFSSLFLSLSPWHISLSRASSEGIISLFLTLSASLLLLIFLKRPGLPVLIGSFFLFFSSSLFYHVPRLLNPLFAALIILYQLPKQSLKKTAKSFLGVFLILIFITTVAFSLNPQARGRFSQVSIFSDLTIKYEQDKLPFEEGHNSVLTARTFHNKLVLYTNRFINEYSQYFSSKFLLVPFEAKPHRYATVGLGLVTYIEFFMIIFGLIAVLKGRYSYVPLLLLLISPIPAALTTEDAPNLHRALFMIPFFSIFAGIGTEYLGKLNFKLSKIIVPSLLVLLALNFIYFWHMYFVHNYQRPQIASNRNVGAKELALKLNEIAPNYQKVLITNIPDSLYPWYAFFTSQDPQTFNQISSNRGENPWVYKNIYFTSQRCPSRDAFKKNNDNILAIDAEGCETEAKYGPNIGVLDRIARGDESYPYILWHRILPDDPKTWEEATPETKLK